MSFFHLLERRLINALLRSRTFTSSVQKVHSKVHEFQHGSKPLYPHPGGTYLEDGEGAAEEAAKRAGGLGRFMKLFWEELRRGHRPVTEAKGKEMVVRKPEDGGGGRR